MVQDLIVAVIVAAALLYALWYWMPKAWRHRVAHRLAAGSRRAGLVDADRAERLASALAKDTGCGACQQCGPAAPPCGTGGPAQPRR